MAIVLNNKISGTITDGTNSYVDTTYAQDYFDNHWDATKTAAWNALQLPQQQRLLIAACADLEQIRFTYQIIKTDWRFNRYYNRLTRQVMNFQLLREPVKWYYYQRLQFPRNLDVDPTTGTQFIPPEVQMAQCEHAIWKVGFDNTALANQLQGVTNDTISIGRGQVHTDQQYSGQGTSISPEAWEMVKKYAIFTTRYRRG